MFEDETLYYQLQEVGSQLRRNRMKDEPAPKPVGYMSTGSDPATGGTVPVYDRFDLALLDWMRANS